MDNRLPIPPVNPRTPSPRAPIGFSTGIINLTKAPNPSPRSFATSNKPLNVFLRFSLFLSLRTNVSVKEWKASNIPYTWSAVAGGKTSLNASLMGLITDTKPFIPFLRESIKSSLPDGFSKASFISNRFVIVACISGSPSAKTLASSLNSSDV